MNIKGYDAWKLATPWDDAPECKCDAQDIMSDDCTCKQDAEDEALERGDYLYEQMRDRSAKVDDDD